MFDIELHNINELAQEQVKELVFKSQNKFCELYPMPTWMIRDCIDEELPLLKKNCNCVTINRRNAKGSKARNNKTTTRETWTRIG